MRILIVGGTRFVGRHIAEAALAAGHDLTLLHRGRSNPDTLDGAEHLLADRDGDLSPVLDGRSYDATIDVCAYWPRQVRSLAAALGDRGGQHVYISSVSAYADPAEPGADESTPLATTDADDPDAVEMSAEAYGPLKALCERAAVAAYGADAVTIVRPSYVVGPYDPTGRFTWWLDRMSRGGPVLGPGPADSPMQLIDARDQAAWVVGLLESTTTGAFHSATPAPPWSLAEMIDAIGAALKAAADLVWVDGAALRAEGIDGGDLPLWSEGADEQVLALDPSAAVRTGLAPRPLAETIRDTAKWMASAQWRRDGVGLDPAREAELLARLG